MLSIAFGRANGGLQYAGSEEQCLLSHWVTCAQRRRMGEREGRLQDGVNYYSVLL